MCIYAQDRSQIVRAIGDGGHGIRQAYGDCSLKKQSPNMQAEICNYHMISGLGGSLISNACPVFPTGAFNTCKYSK